MTSVSKSRFKAQALSYFRMVEKSRKPIIVTDRGRPVVKVIPYSENPDDLMKELRGTVLKYEGPTEPVGSADWEVLQ